MSIEEAHSLYAMFSAFGACAVVAVLVAFALLRFYLPAYLGEKGKNLATREDIAKITREVEQVRLQYSTLVEELKARHQLRLAAIDRRLQAHQDAFVHWYELFQVMHTSEVFKVASKCDVWWNENCLYLEPSVREGFLSCCFAARNHESLLKARSDPKEIKDNWAQIAAFPNLLFAAIKLPGLSELESQSLRLHDSAINAGGA